MFTDNFTDVTAATAEPVIGKINEISIISFTLEKN